MCIFPTCIDGHVSTLVEDSRTRGSHVWLYRTPYDVLLLIRISYTGRNFYYGIREHAMGSILNGISYFGLHRCSGATFLVFADYMRAPMRVAALSELPVNYILTHDSIGVGEVGHL